jgi:hypothetical protein
MLCDQASDEINSLSLPTASHWPPVVFYNTIDQLSIPRVEINWGTATLPLLLIALGSATLPSRASLCIDVRRLRTRSTPW